MKRSLFYFMVLASAFFFGYAAWTVGKRINYAWQYEDMVRATVREMVKESALKASLN